MKIAHISISPAAAGALTAKIFVIVSVPEEKTETVHGNIFKRRWQMTEDSIAWRILEQKKYFALSPILSI